MTDVKKPEDAKKAEDTRKDGDTRQDRPVESASAAPGERRSASRPLLPASESGDPAVQKALADLQTAQMNQATHAGASDEAREAAKGHEEEVQKAKDALAELGYE